MDWARCEISADGFLDQPLDVATGLVAVGAGVWLLGRDHRLVGAALVVSGVASAGYHSWTGPFTGWLDGFGVALIALAFAADARRWAAPAVALGAVGVGALTAPPSLRAGVTGAVVALAVATVLIGERLLRRHLVAATALFGTGILAWWAASDAARCSPDGWFPLHAVWHVAAIAAVSVLVLGRTAHRPVP